MMDLYQPEMNQVLGLSLTVSTLRKTSKTSKEMSMRRILVLAIINLNEGRRTRDLTLKALYLYLKLCSSQE